MKTIFHNIVIGYASLLGIGTIGGIITLIHGGF